MDYNIFEKILSDNLNIIWGFSDSQIESLIKNSDLILKEEVKRIDNLKVIIYSNDQNPPHFHVISKDKKIDAKFTIENCEQISGNLSSKDLKKIKCFYNSLKTKMVLKKIWNKKYN